MNPRDRDVGCMDDDAQTQVDAWVERLALSNTPICIHASMRSFDKTDGQRVEADALLERLLSHGVTVLVPTFTYDLEQPPPVSERPERNGTDYAFYDGRSVTELSFSRTSDALSLNDMGQLPRAVLAHPEHKRGRHPLNSFSAVGPMAEELIEGQTPNDVYAPLDSLTANGGSIVLMGVTYSSMTLIHLAETRAGRQLFQRWANCEGELVRASVGSCSVGFRKFEVILDPMADIATIAGSRWRTLPTLETLMAVTGAIHSDPAMTHCENEQCLRCRDAIEGGPILTAP